MPRLAQLAHRQKKSRLFDALAALAMVVAVVLPTAAVSSSAGTTARTMAETRVAVDHAPDNCAPTSVSAAC